MKKEFFIILCFAILFCLPLFLKISTTFPRLDTDYDSNLPIYQLIISSIHQGHIPWKVPVTQRGFSLLGDPLNSFLNPLFSFPLFLFGINAGLRVSIFLCCLTSGITMWCLLQKQKVSIIGRVWGSLLYMSAGAFIAPVAAGHIEKFLVYPFVPLLLLFILKPAFRFLDNLGCAAVIAATVYSGDLYSTWFFLLLFACSRIYYSFKEKRKEQVITSLLVVSFFFLFASLKLYPFLQDVFPIMKRYSTINPFQGSIHFFLFPLPFIIPWQVNFYDRPFFQKHLGFSFNWYEYYAFLTPFPLLFLLKIKKVWGKKEVKLVVLLLFIGSLYISAKYSYSPFHWIISTFGSNTMFRVPQRIVMPLTSVVVLLFVWCFEVWQKQKQHKNLVLSLAFLSIIWTFCVGQQVFATTFPSHSNPQLLLIKELRQKDKRNFAVASFAMGTQLFLIQQQIPLLNYYYGWIPTTEQTFLSPSGTVPDFSLLSQGHPSYVITNQPVNLAKYGYSLFLKNNTITIWKRL